MHKAMTSPIQKALSKMVSAATLISDALGSRISPVHAHWDGTRFYTAEQCQQAHESVPVADVAVGGVEAKPTLHLVKLKWAAELAASEPWSFGLGRAEFEGQELSALWIEAGNAGIIASYVAKANPTLILDLLQHRIASPQPLPDIAAELYGALKKLYDAIDCCVDLTPELLRETSAILVRHKQAINGKGSGT